MGEHFQTGDRRKKSRNPHYHSPRARAAIGLRFGYHLLAALLIGSLLASHTLLSMIATLHHSLLAIALITLLELAVIARILLRPHRDPASRIAWMVVVGVLPLVGMLAYLLLGEVNIGRRRVERLHAVLKRMPPIPFHPEEEAADFAAAAPERHRISFGSAARSAGSIQRVATPRAFCRTPTPRLTRWRRTSIPQRITSMCCSTSGCRTITAARSSRP